jgi:DNA-binding NtrC family response regulator
MNPSTLGESGDPRGGCGRTQDGQGQRVLLVDDDEDMRSLLADVLSDEGYEVIQAANGAEALVLLHRETFAVILLDKRMPGLSGMDLLPGLRVLCPETPVIVITAFGDAHTAAEGTEKGAFGLLFKPFRMDDLRAMLDHALARPDSPAGTRACQR